MPDRFSAAALEAVLQNLRKNNMSAQYVPHREDVQDAVSALLSPGDRIAVGGSVTLEETGVLDMVRNGPYRFIDRYEAGLTDAEREARLKEAFFADVFLCSANAVIKSGEIYQVDGLSNRIAPLLYGPGSVVVVVGVNKIVEDLDAAVRRVRTVTAPAIVRRRGLETPCAHTGVCSAEKGGMGAGCRCPGRRCCNFLVLGRQRVKDRIKVVLVGEALGF